MSVTTADVGLAAALGAATRRVHERAHALSSAEGLTADQWSVLDFVAKSNTPVAMHEIVEAVGLTGPSLTRAVDKLVTSALMFREVDPGDRRRVLVSPSKRGWAVYAKLAPQMTALEQDLAGSTETAEQILRMLNGLAR
ncbi:MarR family transcriptional regulator [Arthrobacter yangruifuii]|uniref:MarR family transcriptional regulator n=1 Tax=Arthrobacter yangruifuii TaxID=2606616 RepID=A0A5N6MF63_9MICC|nr:MarR family transcriptional regulator [Arthrobacter yangruifuii]KAD3514853.1 MarR family transcriptional regulator [Arthrobacter yangruifuii]